MTKKKSYKCCFVPKCRNTSISAPDKLFVTVPRIDPRRKRWFKAARRYNTNNTSVFFCCEDHFNLESDMENYMRHKLMGGVIHMKKDVIPHIFDCQEDRKRAATARVRPFVAKKLRKELVEQALEMSAKASSSVQSTTDLSCKSLKHTVNKTATRVGTQYELQDQHFLPNEHQHNEQLLINSQQWALHTQTVPAVLLAPDSILLLAEPQSRQTINHIEVSPDVEQHQFIQMHGMEESDGNLDLHTETSIYNDDDPENGDQPSNTETDNNCQDVLSITEHANPDILIYDGQIKKETGSADQDVLFTTVYIKEKYSKLETYTDSSICDGMEIKTEPEVEDQLSNTQVSNSYPDNLFTVIDIKQEGDNVDITDTMIEVKKEVDEQ